MLDFCKRDTPPWMKPAFERPSSATRIENAPSQELPLDDCRRTDAFGVHRGQRKHRVVAGANSHLAARGGTSLRAFGHDRPKHPSLAPSERKNVSRSALSE